jgi:serine/threonine protein kinase
MNQAQVDLEPGASREAQEPAPLPDLSPFTYIITKEHKETLEFALGQMASISKTIQFLQNDFEHSNRLTTPPIDYEPIPVLPDYVPYMYLGGGGEGSAHVFQHRSQKEKACVVKIVVRRDPEQRADPYYRPNEVRILLLLKDLKVKHQNIIDYGGYALNCPTIGRDCVFLEWCNGGDLCSFTENCLKRREPVSEFMVWQVLSQVFDGLASLHEGYQTLYFRLDVNSKIWNPIFHGDIKPENILIQYPANSDDRIGIKIADFGCAIQYNRSAGEPELNENYFAGTAEYAPPEAPLFTNKADVWAAAASIHLLCTGDSPVDVTASDTVIGWRDMPERELLRRTPRRAHDVSAMAVDRQPLDWYGYGHQSWQRAYSEALQYVLSYGLAMDMNMREGALGMVGLITKVSDALEAQQASGVNWRYCFQY